MGANVQRRSHWQPVIHFPACEPAHARWRGLLVGRADIGPKCHHKDVAPCVCCGRTSVERGQCQRLAAGCPAAWKAPLPHVSVWHCSSSDLGRLLLCRLCNAATVRQRQRRLEAAYRSASSGHCNHGADCRHVHCAACIVLPSERGLVRKIRARQRSCLGAHVATQHQHQQQQQSTAALAGARAHPVV